MCYNVGGSGLLHVQLDKLLRTKKIRRRKVGIRGKLFRTKKIRRRSFGIRGKLGLTSGLMGHLVGLKGFY